MKFFKYAALILSAAVLGAVLVGCTNGKSGEGATGPMTAQAWAAATGAKAFENVTISSQTELLRGTGNTSLFTDLKKYDLANGKFYQLNRALDSEGTVVSSIEIIIAREGDGIYSYSFNKLSDAWMRRKTDPDALKPETGLQEIGKITEYEWDEATKAYISEKPVQVTDISGAVILKRIVRFENGSVASYRLETGSSENGVNSISTYTFTDYKTTAVSIPTNYIE